MQGKIFSGAIIVVAMRWSDRLFGLLSTLILARLLVPDDFGVVVMASLFVGLIDVLLDMGVAAALIHNRNCDSEVYSTAWTIRLIQAALAATIIAFSAPLAADYFNDHRVAAVLMLMAATTFIGGLENIGIVTFQKEMAFGRDFQFFFVRRIVGFAATVFLAWHLQSYWALPLGAMASRLIGVLLSYWMHPFRPRLTLTRFQSIWSISQWMLIRNIGVYVDGRLDKLIVGRHNSAAVVGAYGLADEIAAMPSSELLAPLGRVLFPAFVEARENPNTLKKVFLLAMAVQSAIAFPAAIGLSMVAENAVNVLLGSLWSSAVPFVEVLALVYGVSTISHASGYLLLTLGKMRNMAIFGWVQVFIFAAGAFTIFLGSGALAIAQWRLCIAIVGAIFFVALVVSSVDGLRYRDITVTIWRPMTASLVMVIALHLCPLKELSPGLSLILQCGLGAIVYSTVLLGLWIASGKPAGAESYVIEKFSSFLGNLTKR